MYQIRFQQCFSWQPMIQGKMRRKRSRLELCMRLWWLTRLRVQERAQIFARGCRCVYFVFVFILRFFVFANTFLCTMDARPKNQHFTSCNWIFNDFEHKATKAFKCSDDFHAPAIKIAPWCACVDQMIDRNLDSNFMLLFSAIFLYDIVLQCSLDFRCTKIATNNGNG